MKNLFIAVLLAILIIYCLGGATEHWLDFDIHLGDELLSPIWSMTLAACIGVALVLLGFVIAISIFSVIAFVIGAVFVGLFVAGIGAFWPAILLLLIVLWLVKDKRRPA